MDVKTNENVDFHGNTLNPGDIVRIKYNFEDRHGDAVEEGQYLPVSKYDGVYPPIYGVGTVIANGNLEKLELVCRYEDREDK